MREPGKESGAERERETRAAVNSLSELSSSSCKPERYFRSSLLVLPSLLRYQVVPHVPSRAEEGEQGRQRPNAEHPKRVGGTREAITIVIHIPILSIIARDIKSINIRTTKLTPTH